MYTARRERYRNSHEDERVMLQIQCSGKARYSTARAATAFNGLIMTETA